jgi:hypothetical protein
MTFPFKVAKKSLDLVEVAFLTLYYSFLAIFLQAIFVHEKYSLGFLIFLFSASFISFVSYIVIEKELEGVNDRVLAQDFFASFMAITFFYAWYYLNAFLFVAFLIAFAFAYAIKEELKSVRFFRSFFIGIVALSLLELKFVALAIFLILYLLFAFCFKKRKYDFTMQEVFSIEEFFVVVVISLFVSLFN